MDVGLIQNLKILTRQRIYQLLHQKKHTYGQKLRHVIIRNFNLDVYGRGYNKIDNKSTALFDYKFSVIIENCSTKYYFQKS